MHIFHNRPMASACCCLALAAILAYSCGMILPLLIVAVLATATIFILYLWKRNRTLLLICLCLMLSSAALLSSYAFFHVRYERHQALIEEVCTIEGTVIKASNRKSYASVFHVQLDTLNENACDDKIILQCQYASALQIGDRFSATVIGMDFSKDENYDQKSYALPDGILGVYSCEDWKNCTIFEEKDNSLQILFYKWNESLAFRMEEAVGGEEGKLANALLFGNRDAISNGTTLDFRRTGISHLLALSGLHVSILIGIFEWLLKKLACPRLMRIVTVTVLSIAYLLLTGCAPSTTRAVLMLCVLNVGFILREEYDSFTALCMILALFLLITPYAVADIGMWMSFIATASIVVFVPALNHATQRLSSNSNLPKPLVRIFSSLFSAIFIGVIANLALLAIQAIAFGEYSLLSVPATVLLSVPLSLTLVMSILSVLIPPLGFLGKFSAGIMLEIADRLSSIDGILLAIGDVFSIILILLVTASLIFIAIFKLKRVLLWCILPLALSLSVIPISIFVTHLQYDGVKVDYAIEYGGDVFLFAENGRCVAIDFSDGTASGAADIASAAKEARCTELTDLIISHYHNRGTYFIYYLSGLIRVHNIRLPLPKNDWEADIAARMEQEATLHGITVRYDMEKLCIQSLSITVLDHALFASGRHPALLMSVTSNEKTLTYVNGSLPDSTLYSASKDVIEKTDILIIGSTGHSIHTIKKLPSTEKKLEALVLSNEKGERILPQDLYMTDAPEEEPRYTFYLK